MRLLYTWWKNLKLVEHSLKFPGSGHWYLEGQSPGIDSWTWETQSERNSYYGILTDEMGNSEEGLQSLACSISLSWPTEYRITMGTSPSFLYINTFDIVKLPYKSQLFFPSHDYNRREQWLKISHEKKPII